MRSLIATALVATCATLCSCSDDRRVGSGPAGKAGDPTGGFSLRWRLVDAAQADPGSAPAIACADGHVTQIRLGAHNQDTSEDFTWTFPCQDGKAVSPNVTIGTYTISIDALDDGGSPRASDQWPFDNRDSGDLGLEIFPVSRS